MGKSTCYSSLEYTRVPHRVVVLQSVRPYHGSATTIIVDSFHA
jgi:hypothetical protein